MLLYFHTFWPCQLQIGHKFEFYLFALLQDIYICTYMGQFLQGGKNGHLMSFFFKK